MRILFIVLIALVTFSSCYYDKADQLYPVVVCDTATVVSYSTKLVPIFQSQCYGCHSASNASGGIAMGTYAADKAIAANGKLYGSVTHSSGYSAMPKGGTKLTTCQLRLIKSWIDNGMPNN